MDAASRFRALLELELPKTDHPFSLWHVKSHTKKCRKLIFTRTHDTTPNTCCQHLCLITYKGILIFGIEVFIYESPDFSTVFISKADTSGFYDVSEGRLNVGLVTRAVLKGILRYYVPVHKKVRICLFAKSQGQYLFLGSKNNPRKHILGDGQLVRWWLQMLDSLSEEFDEIKKSCLIIPGCNSRDTTSYFPRDPKITWTVGDIFWEDDPKNENTLAIRRIPRFPDDPKTRFLESLVSAKRAKQVTRNQFWEEMPSRQEFLLCKSVGIIGLEGFLKGSEHMSVDGAHSVSQSDYKLIMEVLLSLDFSSKESASHATEEIAKRIPDFAIIEIEGQKAQPELKATERPPEGDSDLKRNINVLGAGLVRKKRKGNSTIS